MPSLSGSFESVASLPPSAGQVGFWSKPSCMLDLGGQLAVWCEAAPPQPEVLRTKPLVPWLVLHGGPGGSLTAAHVAPLRFAGVPWFGFDQRNSGLSEDLDLSQIDLQRFIDDALDLADRLGVERFHVLGGSWGGTLAMALAAYRPERAASVILRAPFIPSLPRVNAFFSQLEQIDPELFAESFGAGARTAQICNTILTAAPERALGLCKAWRNLELRLLTGQSATQAAPLFYTDLQEFQLLRKYRLQSHFLLHGCFLDGNDWEQMLIKLQVNPMPLTIVQGQADLVCPPGGAAMLAEIFVHATLVNLPDVGHLPDSSAMIAAITQQVTKHQLLA
ncbi:MAG TPA: alpha/beta fold hydrolase [Limnobacter sp.]|nr:alpha/beta fold hydrolase [Limnobacter sp.]